MSSLYLETIYIVHNRIKSKFNIPIIWGGVYPTLFPEDSLKYADYVIQGEGELPLLELLESLENDIDPCLIQNVAMVNNKNIIKKNPLRPLVQNLDVLGYPKINKKNTYLIHSNEVNYYDPVTKRFTYELTASRGCPFTCSYCSSVNLKRLYMGKGKFVRFRTVDNVIEELMEAKANIKNLKVIHFWDEIFSNEDGWIEEFNKKYKKNINIPFKVWGHPLKIDENTINYLVDAGLYQIVVGIQSGSAKLRKDVFRRNESQNDIINSSRILSKCNVPKVIYDFMLQHPFESLEDLKETYKLCLQLEPPFELQIHGLNFLPGTDIVDMAIEANLLSEEELKKIMFSSIKDQYHMYWGPSAKNRIHENQIWISLIYLTQFPKLRPVIQKLASNIHNRNNESYIRNIERLMKHIARIRNISDKAKLVLNRT